jgi:protein associated with RNAse G/E
LEIREVHGSRITFHDMATITVIKRDFNGEETWRYSGELLELTDRRVVLEAIFDREDRLFYGMPLRMGDRFVETYYFDRWYNIYKVYSREEGSLRGWYCNIGSPAVMNGDTLSYIDLALDLLVFPDGRQVVLDEDEFALLPIPDDTREKAASALNELQTLFRTDRIQKQGQ